MFDQLGGLFAGPAAEPQMGAPDPNLKSQWDGWLSNPANRAGMLSFGLSLMTPQWGNQFANAMGAAAEGYGGAEKAMRDEAERQAAIGRSEAAREDTQAHQKEMQELESQAALTRTKVARGEAQSDRTEAKEQARWDRAYYYMQNKLNKQNAAATESNNDPLRAKDAPLVKVLDDADILLEAERFADETVAKGPGKAGRKTSEISGGGSGQGGNAPAAKSAPVGDVGAAPATAPKVSAEQFAAGSNPETVAKMMSTPEGRAWLQNKVADPQNLPGWRGSIAPVPASPAADPSALKRLLGVE